MARRPRRSRAPHPALLVIVAMLLLANTATIGLMVTREGQDAAACAAAGGVWTAHDDGLALVGKTLVPASSHTCDAK